MVVDHVACRSCCRSEAILVPSRRVLQLPGWWLSSAVGSNLVVTTPSSKPSGNAFSSSFSAAFYRCYCRPCGDTQDTHRVLRRGFGPPGLLRSGEEDGGNCPSMCRRDHDKQAAIFFSISRGETETKRKLQVRCRWDLSDCAFSFDLIRRTAMSIGFS